MSHSPAEARQRLYRAILDGDGQIIERWLEDGQVDFDIDYDATPLEVAIAGSDAMDDRESKDDVEAESSRARASNSSDRDRRRRDTVRLLLDLGADPRNSYDSILPRAAKTGDERLVELLILAGAEDNRSEAGDSALEIAARSGHRAMVRLLLEAFGASFARSALWDAALAGHGAIFRQLEGHVEDEAAVHEARRRLRRTSRLEVAASRLLLAQELCDAIDAGDHAQMKARLRDGASPDAFTLDWDGEVISALRRAAESGDSRIAKLLIQAGAAVDGPEDEEGRLEETTPLHAAIRVGAFSLAGKLIDAGADVAISAKSGAEGPLTPLLILVIDGLGRPEPVDLGSAQALLNRLVLAGVEIDAQDAQGRTALIWTARRPAPKILDTLLKLGASPEILDHDGHSAAAHAYFRSLITSDKRRRNIYRDIHRRLEGPVPHRLEIELMAAAFKGERARCVKYLERGADKNHQLEGWCALDYARAGQHADLVALLDN